MFHLLLLLSSCLALEPRVNPYGPWPLVTPLLGVGEECKAASLAYVEGLQANRPWALRMFDSSGQLPFLQEGLLSDTMDTGIKACNQQLLETLNLTCAQLCSLLEQLLNGFDLLSEWKCPENLDDLTIKVPYGHGTGLGNQGECLAVTEMPTHYCHNAIQMTGIPLGSKLHK